MSMPLVPFILGKDSLIRGHEIEYMIVPLGLTDGWGFALILDWAWGLTFEQASFQTPRWVLGSLAG